MSPKKNGRCQYNQTMEKAVRLREAMAQKKRYTVLITVLIIAIWAAALLFDLERLHYGVEISDEAFYVAEAYIVTEGAIPFTNNWMHVCGAALLYAPLVKLYTVVSGGTEGIFLFMRYAFLFYKMVVSGVLMLLFKRKLPMLLSLLLPLPYFALSNGISTFSYNTLSVSLLLISATLLFIALQEGERHSGVFCAIGGIVMALTILAHFMQLFTAVLVVLLLLIFERKRFGVWHRTFSFILGGFATAFLVVLYLSVVSNGFMPVLNGIAYILKGTYFHVKKAGLVFNLKILGRAALLFKDFMILELLVFIACLLAVYAARRKREIRAIDLKPVYAASLLIAQCVYIGYVVFQNTGARIDYNITSCYAFIMLLLLPTANRKMNAELLLLIFSPFALSYLLNIPFVWSGLSSREYLLFPAVMLSIAFTYQALEDLPILKGSASKSLISYACVSLLAGVITAAYVMGSYGFVYRDAPIPELIYKMESGVYKGLYTVEERGKALLQLEAEISKATDKKDRVLFMDQAPEAYLMTSAEHCTPSTWDILLYSYAYCGRLNESYDSMNDYLLQAYFSVSGKVPDKIIYVQDKERLAHISLWNENYKFNQYVARHYAQTYANNAEQFAIIVFERNDG